MTVDLAAGYLTTGPNMADGRGVPVGVAGWRLVIEYLGSPPASATQPAQWGISHWDTAPASGRNAWTSPVWVDITGDARGMTWRRGSDQPFGRPRTGSGTLTLNSPDGRYDPEGAAGAAWYYAPGTLLRATVAAAVGGDWTPQWVGVVTNWRHETAGVDATAWATVDWEETSTLLAATDQPAVEPVGASEDCVTRLTRLIAAASGATNGLGLCHEANEAARLMAATSMAGNRLAECWLSADSVDLAMYPHRSGLQLLTTVDARSTRTAGAGPADRRHSTYYYPGGVQLAPTVAGASPPANSVVLVYDADTLRRETNRDAVRNDVRLACVGGTEQIARDGPSIARWGRHPYIRHDLIPAKDDLTVAAVAAAIVARQGKAVRRIAGCRLTGRLSNLPALWRIDVGDLVTIVRPDGTNAGTAAIASTTHAVTALNTDRLDWRIDVAIDQYT